MNRGAACRPAILAYDTGTVGGTLDAATSSSLEASVEYDRERDRVSVPRLCLSFVGDFGGPSGLREFLREYDRIPSDVSPSLRFADHDWTREPRKFAD